MDLGQVAAAPEEYELPGQEVGGFAVGEIWEVTREPPMPDPNWSHVGKKSKKCKLSCCTSKVSYVSTKDKEVNYVGKEGELDAVSHQEEGWEKVTLKIDSGAIDTVFPPGAAQAFPVKPTEASKAGQGYRAANGSKIPAFGEKVVSGFTGSWLPFNITAQVAGVKSPLGSVYHMIKAGNRLVFDSGGSYMVNKASGRTQPINERAGSFEIDLWVQQGQSEAPQSVTPTHNRYGALEPVVEDEEVSMGFIRQVNP